MNDEVLKRLGINPKSYCPQDVYNRIDRLLRAEEHERQLLRERAMYQLALKLQNSKTPLSDIAKYLDTHTTKGDVSSRFVHHTAALCRELEYNSQHKESRFGDEPTEGN